MCSIAKSTGRLGPTCLTTADIPSAPKGIQGQVGWSLGQPELVPDLEAANPVHDRGLERSDLWSLFPSRTFYGAMILWTRAWGDELWFCSRSVRGYTREKPEEQHITISRWCPKGSLLPTCDALLSCCAFCIFEPMSMSSLWSTTSHTPPLRDNFCALFRAFLFFSSSCMYAKGKKSPEWDHFSLLISDIQPASQGYWNKAGKLFFHSKPSGWHRLTLMLICWFFLSFFFYFFFPEEHFICSCKFRPAPSVCRAFILHTYLLPHYAPF